ncbi:MAG: GDSL-type esterase/lipase family protein [Chlorobiales bacterium]|nr:GDSL-type esterase/lipase family protein [Chlorobiales bacterium]
MRLRLLLLCCLTMIPGMLLAAALPPVLPDSSRNSYVHSEMNRLSRSDVLKELKRKLERGQSVRIIHLGDSHVQADMMTRVVRRGLQERYGNAGRGLVFAYQLAGTNAPSDIESFSSIKWSATRLMKQTPPMTCGICGYVVSTDSLNADLAIGVKQARAKGEFFDRVRIFASGGGRTNLRVSADDALTVTLSEDELAGRRSVDLPVPTERVYLDKSGEVPGFAFYGISFEKKEVPGIIYDAIGVNGADYAAYVGSDLFWQQIGTLGAGAYVVALGTNEAQNQQLNFDLFADQVRTMVRKLKQVSPGAVVILSTPPPSYYRRTQVNPLLETIADTIVRVADEEGVVSWDLFHAANAAEGASEWQKFGLFRPDKVHYSRAGYELQGEMMLDLFMRQLGD